MAQQLSFDLSIIDPAAVAQAVAAAGKEGFRRCLRCEQDFWSWGAGNRRCKNCPPDDSGMSEFSVAAAF